MLLHRDETQRDRISQTEVHDQARFHWIPFADIRAAIKWVATDTVVMVAGLLYDQIAGLPMGSTLSPALARAYLDVNHDKLFNAPKKLPDLSTALAKLGRPTAAWIQTECHVDDSLWLSRAVCTACLVAIATAVWPKDVGLSVEAVGDAFTFLHCDVRVNPEGLYLAPRTPNEEYARGSSASPAVSAYALYVPGFSTLAQLRSVLAAKLHLLVRGFRAADWRTFVIKTIITALEPVRLGWPPKWVANILCCTMYVGNRTCSRLLRQLGIWLRSNDGLARHATQRQLRGSESELEQFYCAWISRVADFVPGN